jgi:hypothetical protein
MDDDRHPRRATFCRLIIHGPEDLVVDLAVDSPPASPTTTTLLGPTLAPLELAARKLLALFGRAEAGDFADVYVLQQRFGTRALLDLATQIDPGFGEHVLAEMLLTLGRSATMNCPSTMTIYLNRTNRSGVLNAGVIGGQAQTGRHKIDARFNVRPVTSLERCGAANRGGEPGLRFEARDA